MSEFLHVRVNVNFYRCCGSGLFVSDPDPRTRGFKNSDPDPDPT